MNPQQLEKLVQFVHPEKAFGYLPGVNDSSIAALYGLDAATYRALKSRFDANARRAAEELLVDSSFAARVDRLPVRAGATVVGIGESVTADRQSWLEILRHLLELRRPRDGIRFISEGVEGRTTAHALAEFPNILARRPDWIIAFLGAADAPRMRHAPSTLVSLEKTARNLVELRELAATRSEARWVWITPPTVNEEIASRFPPFQQIGFTLRNDDLVAIGDIIRRQPDPVVDIQAVFGRPAPAAMVLSDGIHPSLAGQKAIAKALVERLTS